MGLGASSLALGYMEGHRQNNTLEFTDNALEKGIVDTLNRSETVNNCSANTTHEINRTKDENENFKKARNKNYYFGRSTPVYNLTGHENIWNTSTSGRDTPVLHNRGDAEGDNSLASEAIDITNGSDEYSDTETAHECVVILGDKDFDLINRVARIEAKMNTFEEEKETMKRFMEKDAIIRDLQNQLQAEKNASAMKDRQNQTKIYDLENQMASQARLAQEEIKKVSLEAKQQQENFEKIIHTLKEEKENIVEKLIDRDNEMSSYMEEIETYKESKEAELDSYKKALDELEKCRLDLRYKYEAAIQLVQKTRNEMSKRTIETQENVKVKPSTPRAPSKLPSMFHTGINTNIEKMEVVFKKMADKMPSNNQATNPKSNNQATEGLSQNQRKSTRTSNMQNNQRANINNNKINLRRSSPKDKVVLTDKKFRRSTMQVKGVDVKNNNKKSYTKERILGTGKESTKADDKKKLTVPDKKQNGGQSAVSPEVHSVASLLKRHSSGYPRRKESAEEETIKKKVNYDETD